MEGRVFLKVPRSGGAPGISFYVYFLSQLQRLRSLGYCAPPPPLWKEELSYQLGTIEQNLPQPYMKGLFGRSRGPRGQRTLVRELRHNIGLG